MTKFSRSVVLCLWVSFTISSVSFARGSRNFVQKKMAEEKEIEELEEIRDQERFENAVRQAVRYQDNHDLNIPLSEDILFYGLSFLEPRDLAKVARLNKAWNRVTNDSRLWKNILRRTYTKADETGLIRVLLSKGTIQPALQLLATHKDARDILQLELRSAVLDRRWKIVKELVAIGANLNKLQLTFTQIGPGTQTSIFEGDVFNWAMRNAVPYDARRLVKLGADFNKPDYKGETPLHHAVQYGNLDFVTTLLQMGADRYARTYNNVGHNSVEYAAMYGSPQMLRLLLMNVFSEVNRRNPDNGFTLLQFALSNRYHSVKNIQVLLEFGADPSICNNVRQNAYERALSMDHTEAAELLAPFWRRCSIQ
jgi:ankyrin repeat protein